MFYEIRFPEAISYNFEIINEFKTDVITSKNGKEQRNAIWNNDKLKFKINNENLNQSEILEISNFFRLMKGMSNGFRFKNWINYSAIGEFLGIYTDNNKFQLIQNYIINDIFNTNFSLVKKILKPVVDTVQIFINDIEITNFTTNYSTGLVTINANINPNDIITANFEFDIPVRFNNDILKLNMEDKSIGKILDIELVEI